MGTARTTCPDTPMVITRRCRMIPERYQMREFASIADEIKSRGFTMSAVRSLPRGDFEVRFLTVAEVAAIMRVSKMTVYRLVHSGELEATRVGRFFRFSEQAVNRYLNAAFVGTG